MKITVSLIISFTFILLLSYFLGDNIYEEFNTRLELGILPEKSIFILSNIITIIIGFMIAVVTFYTIKE